MPSNEDLYQQMLEEEAEYNEQASRNLKVARGGQPPPQREVNHAVARERYNRDVRPVIERIKRAEAGKPITRNPVYNAWLKLTGQDKVPMPEVVDPVFGLAKQTGMTVEEVRAEILAHPELYPDLSRKAPKVQVVPAVRKTAADLRGNR